jgi:hypothetical protein
MKLVLLGKKRAHVLEFSFSTAPVREVTGDDDDEEQGEQLRYDPRSTVNSSLERRSDIEDSYGMRRFGFHGS